MDSGKISPSAQYTVTSLWYIFKSHMMCRDCPAFRRTYPKWWGNSRNGIHSVFYEAWARHAFYRSGNGGGGGESCNFFGLILLDVGRVMWQWRWCMVCTCKPFMIYEKSLYQTGCVMKRCSLGCIHLDSDSQLLRGPWGGVGEGRVSRHNAFFVSGVDAKMLPAVYLFISFLPDLPVGIPTWKSLQHFSLVVLSPVATVKS